MGRAITFQDALFKDFCKFLSVGRLDSLTIRSPGFQRTDNFLGTFFGSYDWTDEPRPGAKTRVMLGDEFKAYRWARRLLDLGVFVSAVVYPAVSPGQARLRLCATAAHRAHHFDRLFEGLAACQELEGCRLTPAQKYRASAPARTYRASGVSGGRCGAFALHEQPAVHALVHVHVHVLVRSRPIRPLRPCRRSRHTPARRTPGTSRRRQPSSRRSRHTPVTPRG